MDTSDNYNVLPSFESLLANRIQSKMVHKTNNSTFDPCDMMTKRKNGEEILPSVQQWPEEDIKELEEYCKKMGIVGFSAGRMSPKIALSMLKQRMGDYSNTKMEDRTPIGYKKQGGKDLLCG